MIRFFCLFLSKNIDILFDSIPFNTNILSAFNENQTQGDLKENYLSLLGNLTSHLKWGEVPNSWSWWVWEYSAKFRHFGEIVKVFCHNDECLFSNLSLPGTLCNLSLF